MFVEPDGRPFCDGPDLFSNARTRTTIFKQHQRRAYFQFADRQLALVHGRLFCARERNPLDRIVELMNQDPRTGGKMGGNTVPRDAMTIPVDDSILWAGRSADLVGLAVGRDGLVALHQNTVEGLSVDGESIWTLPLPAAPVRWGLAMAGKRLIVSLVDGQVVGVAPQS